MVDPGGDAELILSLLKKHQARAAWVIHSHAHIDHVGATADVREKGGASCQCGFHKEEQWLIENLDLQSQFLGLPLRVRPIEQVDHWLTDGESLKIGEELRVDVLHTPGHTPGSLSFLVSEGPRPQVILSGDTLFLESVGRTDLWGGDWDTLHRSICTKLFTWPEEIPVIPGHGPATTIAHEKENNPFLRGTAF